MFDLGRDPPLGELLGDELRVESTCAVTGNPNPASPRHRAATEIDIRKPTSLLGRGRLVPNRWSMGYGSTPTGLATNATSCPVSGSSATPVITPASLM